MNTHTYPHNTRALAQGPWSACVMFIFMLIYVYLRIYTPNNANCRGSDGVARSAHGSADDVETLPVSILYCNLHAIVTPTLKSLR